MLTGLVLRVDYTAHNLAHLAQLRSWGAHVGHTREQLLVFVREPCSVAPPVYSMPCVAEQEIALMLWKVAQTDFPIALPLRSDFAHSYQRNKKRFAYVWLGEKTTPGEKEAL